MFGQIRWLTGVRRALVATALLGFVPYATGLTKPIAAENVIESTLRQSDQASPGTRSTQFAIARREQIDIEIAAAGIAANICRARSERLVLDLLRARTMVLDGFAPQATIDAAETTAGELRNRCTSNGRRIAKLGVDRALADDEASRSIADAEHARSWLLVDRGGIAR